ncbi:MAG: PAS domain-containing protein [Bacteroidales bacterium]|nr:PAS domain-containing protein [Bacteroidales bacterium]
MSKKPSYSDLVDKITKLEKEIEALNENALDFKNNEMIIRNLFNEKEKFRLIADYTYDWEFWLNPDGKCIYSSPSCKKITGYSSEEIIANPDILLKIVHPNDLNSFKKYIKNALELNAEDKQFEFRIITRSKKQRWIGLYCQAVYDNEGKYLGQRGSNRDITKLKLAEQKIKKAKKKQESSKLEKEKILKDIDSKNHQLASFAILLSQKNEVLMQTQKEINKLADDFSSISRQKLQALSHKIKSNIQSEKNWNNFKLHFENVHSGFFKRLNIKFPNLTPKDQKLCAYLRLNLSTKEIAQLLSITPGSAEISRIRLRKKLSLTKKINLVKFISSI